MHGNFNKQNSWLMKQNLNHQNGIPLHLAIYMVWCILSAVGIVSLAFLKECVNSVMWHFWQRTLFLLCKEWTVISMYCPPPNNMVCYHIAISVLDIVNTLFHDQEILNHCPGWFLVRWCWPQYCINPRDCAFGAVTVTLKASQM